VYMKYKPNTSIVGGLAEISPDGASSLVNRFRSGKCSPGFAFGTIIVNFAAKNQCIYHI